MEMLMQNHGSIFELLTINGGIILPNDNTRLFQQLMKLKSTCFHFMKIVWQYKSDLTCLPVLVKLLQSPQV
jgi:hypothetical protein